MACHEVLITPKLEGQMVTAQVIKHENVNFECIHCCLLFYDEDAYNQHAEQHSDILLKASGDIKEAIQDNLKKYETTIHAVDIKKEFPHEQVESVETYKDISSNNIMDNKPLDIKEETPENFKKYEITTQSANIKKGFPNEKVNSINMFIEISTNGVLKKNSTDIKEVVQESFVKCEIPIQLANIKKEFPSGEDPTVNEFLQISDSSVLEKKAAGIKADLENFRTFEVPILCESPKKTSENSFLVPVTFVDNGLDESKAVQSETKYKNNESDIKWKSSSTNNFHTNLAKQNFEKNFTCEVCPRTFKRKSLFVKHTRTHTEETLHTSKKLYSCEICNQTFRINAHFIIHMRTHTGEKPYVCEICKHDFTQKSTLVTHMRKHTGEKPFVCKICGQKFARNNNLVRHMKNHTGEKTHICEICNNKFTERSDLVRHTRTHTGEKPYVCKICNTKFSSSGILVTHMRTHTGEKPYVCTICHYKSTSSNNLASHMRIHTGVTKYFTCQVCDRKFSVKSNLVRHMRIHTRE